MGSSFSVQTKANRRRSNRLSKPPQNQAAPGCSSSHSLHQPGDQAFSLPSTPTEWQNPWTGAPVAVSDDFGSHNLRSQSLSAKPLRRETTWKSKRLPVAERGIHTAAGIWPPPHASPTPTPTRRGSLYGRTSFHPSEVVTFQPTTLQSNPQSPLIGQPKRSYSVHSPSQRARSAVQQRHTLDRFASFNSHTRVKCQEVPQIRRRSLLVRPGVATRKATKKATPVSSEFCHDAIVSPDPSNALSEPGLPPWHTHVDVLFSDVKAFSQLRPATPSDLGYTHLGSLKLGSLHVVNGSASPCPSDRSQLEHSESLTSETIPDDVDATDLSGAVKVAEQVSRSASLDGLEMYAKYYAILDTPRGLDNAVSDISGKAEKSHLDVLPYPSPSARNGIRTGILNTSCAVAERDNVDFPASPFSFEKPPTSILGHGIEGHGTDDEGVSVHDREGAVVLLPDKVPERHLSYSSCASSHRRGDSGYSSATSHRNSLDSHTSLQRSPGFRRFTLEDCYKNLNSRDLCTAATASIQPFNNHDPGLQNHKSNVRQVLRNRPASIPRAQRGQPQIIASSRSRGLSFPVPRSSDSTYPVPLHSTQPGSLSYATAGLPFPTTLHTIDSGMGQEYGTSRPNCNLDSLCQYAAISTSGYCGSRVDIRERTDFSDNTAALFTSHHAMRNQNCSINSHPAEPEGCQTGTATLSYPSYSSAAKADNLPPMPGNAFSPLSLPDQKSTKFAVEPPRGRTRSRSIGYQYREPSGQRIANLAAVFA
ncbi:hypothetical protein AN5780.2 [Aspergillus nidulans FGSC A4]|uniref:Uncharacterized protein n=1 Tax=Emericella nidulans (strain FGSC A4 / ATCC 38163 / CBS 112.46 / NRRL 194 / M139) TaxID=227321 RepID=Q5B100_EMENI|nr:hypothetical protein [Aspergillus nidulans FGSC A4]EAA62873.1 hypothetical protein AN5780.2 [Aspergillus nidulans FGSC A4]CBF81207.1 TPA: conserved hypothetical protein [Aspergillus nidulans FGSC A4]|eukprot:XP_663384.1 hypothetical protein AN5780.2 [Aspergillus nidulans FGSC A4]